MSKKGWRKLILAVILVTAISTTLWFAAPVSALTINITNPSPTYLGSNISFDITINIEDGELLPIQNIDLYIFNTADRTNYEAACPALPLSDGEQNIYSDPDFGTVTVDASTSWGQDYGYGYAEWQGSPYYFGYGYGYGPGPTSITYAITWDSPSSGWPTGGYTAEVTIVADGTSFTDTLDFTLSKYSGGGGGGGGGPDRSGPRFSKHALCGIGLTTADICWSTHEKSTSQVSYGLAAGTYDLLSELDETLVYEHHVTLTGLTPGTTYYYQVMSADKAENMSTSDEMSFTTQGVAPTFAVTSLAIDPAEADIGQTVTVTVIVANLGDGSGQYQANLMVDDAVVATKEVTIAGHSDQTITFSLTQEAAGTYSLSINGQSVSLVIKEAPAPPPVQPPVTPPEVPTPTPTPINWWLIGGIVVAVMIAATVVWLTVIRQRA